MGNKSFQKLPPRSIRAWQWGNGLGNLYLIALPILYSLFFFDNLNLSILIPLVLFVLTIWISSVSWYPYLKWKHWRYGIDEDEIHLIRGVVVKRETLIPLNRVQHVDTRQGPLLKWYKLSSVSISTAATTHEIPNLDEIIAGRVRSTISNNARLAKEDV